MDRILDSLRRDLWGMEVVDKIVAAPRDEFDNPLQPMTMTVKE